MNIRETLVSTLENYQKINKGDFKGSKPDYLSENKLRESFSLKSWGSNYKIKGSVGQGNWATIPWIAIFDSDISESAQKGFYIVYLFSKDMKKVYLSLNQGWTYFSTAFKPKKDAKKYITYVSNYWQNNLKIQTLNNKISINPINLEANYPNSSTQLPEGYELGNIFSIEYKIDSMPQNEELIKDIENFKYILAELKANLKNLDQIDFLDKNISNIIEFEKNKIDLNQKNVSTVTQVNPPKIIDSKLSSSDISRTISKLDYKKQAASNEEIGKLGERLIFESEQTKFKNLPEIYKNIEWVSKTKGDGLGYDIISFDEKNHNKRYIEVKTTTSNINQPFYITKNELKAIEEFGKAYSIFRVFKVYEDNIDYFEIDGETLQSKYNLIPINYEVSLGIN